LDPEFPVFGALRHVRHTFGQIVMPDKSLRLKAFKAQSAPARECVEAPQNN